MTVHLVGAGPGDPELLTVKALRLIRSCDVLVHDALVSEAVVAEAPEDALVVSRAGMGQAEVNRILIGYGRAGLEVVRLKGGDPFVFGRGGEELLALAQAGVAAEVVPGVSALAAVPGSASIPVTHRGVADRVTLATAHAADGSEPDYRALAAVGGTLVLFMGLERLAALVDGLVDAGLAPDLPAAVVSRGTTPDERVAAGPLRDLPSLADGLASPALVVVGEVVGLREALGLTAAATTTVAAS